MFVFVSMVLMASAAPLTLTVGEEEGGGKVCSTTLKKYVRFSYTGV